MRRLYYFSWRDECPFALVLAFLLSAVYWLTLPPGVTFEDTGLFATVCYNAGIAHPPGYPLHTLLCIPFCPPCRFFYRSIRHKQRRFYHRWPPLPPPFCFMKSPDGCGGDEPWRFFLAAALGLGDRFWSQAIIPETYTLNALLVVATLLFILRFHAPPEKMSTAFYRRFFIRFGSFQSLAAIFNYRAGFCNHGL